MTRKIYVDLSNSIEAWRQKTNILSDYVGDLDKLITEDDDTIVQAINSIESKVVAIDDVRTSISLVAGGSGNYATLTYDNSTGVFTYMCNALQPNQIPPLDAGKITSGVFNTARIPNLDAGKIISGQFNINRIPSLPAGKITTGQLDINIIPALPASKITSGTLDPAVLPTIPDNLFPPNTVLKTQKLIGDNGIVIDNGGFLSSDLTLELSYASLPEISAGIADKPISPEGLSSYLTSLGITGGGGTPVGTVIAFAALTPPDGYLKADGSAVSRTTYSALYGVLGTTFGEGDGSTTFNLPDLRGEFVRGYDDGRGIDPETGRAFGSSQSDEFAAHRHKYEAEGDPLLEVRMATDTIPGNEGVVNDGSGATSTQTTLVGGAETRPRNVTLLYCIKY